MSATVIPIAQPQPPGGLSQLAIKMAESYLKREWKLCLFRHGNKGPTSPGWNRQSNAVVLPSQLTTVENVGLLHALSGTCALDIDHLELAKVWLAERGIDLEQLLAAEGAVQIVSGRPGSAKLVYALSVPLPSKKVVIDHEGGKQVALEFRCASANGASVQDVLPPSLHPSGSVYEWAGAGASDGLPGTLPCIPDNLLAVWKQLIEQSSRANVRVPNSYPASFNDAVSALSVLSPDMPRKDWVELGMGLHHAFDGSDEAFDLWDSWSSKSDKYNATEMPSQWRSFKDDMVEGVTIGTLFRYAVKAGWQRPPPDVSKMFNPVVTASDGTVKKTLLSPKEIIGRLCPKSPAFPIELLPSEMGAYALEISETTRTDPMVPAFAGLAALSGAIDARSRLKAYGENFEEPPILWLMTIGEPGDKKTPGSKPMFKPLELFEAEDKPRYAAEKLGWTGKAARYAAQLKAYTEWSSSPEATLPNAVPPTMDPEPAEPVKKRLIVTDVTTAKAVTLVAARPYGMLAYRDELAGLLQGIAKPGGVNDRSVWTSAYNAAPYNFDRTGQGEIHVPCLALALYGNCQPKVFGEVAALLATDGFLQRAIIGVPESARKGSGRPLPDWLPSCKDAYTDMLRRAMAAGEQHYTTDAEGQELFFQWAEKVENLRERLSDQGHDTTVTGAVAKLSGLAVRFALVCHMATEPYRPVVPATSVRRAIEFCNTFALPSIYAAAEVSGYDPLERWLVGHLLKASGHYLAQTLRDITKSAHRQKRHGEHKEQFDARMRSALEGLEAVTNGEWVRQISSGRTDSYAYAINPAIAVEYQAEQVQAFVDRAVDVEHFRTSKAPKKA